MEKSRARIGAGRISLTHQLFPIEDARRRSPGVLLFIHIINSSVSNPRSPAAPADVCLHRSVHVSTPRASLFGVSGLGIPARRAQCRESAGSHRRPGRPAAARRLLRLGTVRWRACTRFLAFTPDGKTLVTGEYSTSNGVIRCWDTATGKETASFHIPACPLPFALSPDGKTLAVDATQRRTPSSS